MQIKQYTPTSHKIKAVVYGASGSGKTSFGGTAKNAIFASAEGGLLSIADKLPNYVEIKSLNDLKELYQYLKTQKHGFEAVIIDSITEINEVIKLDIEKRTGRAMQLQDWGTLSKDIKNILRSFRDLPMHVLFIAQEMADEKDEAGVAAKIVPSLNGKASTEIAYFMDIVGYIYITKGGEHKIITGSNARLLTKDRSKLIGNDTAVDFSVWVSLIENMKIGEEKITVDYTAPDTTSEAPAKPVAKASSTFDTAKLRIQSMATVAHIQEAMTKIDGMKTITDEQKAELKNIAQERIVGLQYDEEIKVEPLPETPVTEAK